MNANNLMGHHPTNGNLLATFFAAGHHLLALGPVGGPNIHHHHHHHHLHNHLHNPPHNHNHNGNAQGNAQGNGNNNGRTTVPKALRNLGLNGEDIRAIPGPLPNSAAELEDYKMPVFSLRKLEVAGAGCMEMRPDGYYVAFRTLASLTTIAGCLGIELDVVFCQGAKCAYGINADIKEEYVVGHPRDTYYRLMPHMPGERVFKDKSGRTFRIPKHCIRKQTQAPPVVPMAQAPPPAQSAFTVAPPVVPPITMTAPVPPSNQPHNTLVLSVLNNVLNYTPPPPPPPTSHAVPAVPAVQPASALATATPVSAPAQQHPTSPPVHSQLHSSVAPPHSLANTTFFQPQTLDFRAIIPMSEEQKRNPRRRIAMEGGPRGVCEGCGREIWLCAHCNNLWVLYCGGCSAKTIGNGGNPSGGGGQQQAGGDGTGM